MVKLVYCIRRREGISAAEFRKYWREDHAPKVQLFAKALHARRYVQSHTLDSVFNEALRASRGARVPYDGITEVWWDSEDELAAAMGDPDGAEAGRQLLEDERKFIDFEHSSIFLTQEHEIF
jgi:uncharacterized protein (TIGR02118 family)